MNINPSPITPATSPSINITTNIIPITIKVLIVIAQYFIYLKALSDNSEKVLFLFMQLKSHGEDKIDEHENQVYTKKDRQIRKAIFSSSHTLIKEASYIVCKQDS